MDGLKEVSSFSEVLFGKKVLFDVNEKPALGTVSDLQDHGDRIDLKAFAI